MIGLRLPILFQFLLGAPHIGYLPLKDGRVRPVVGVAGSFLVGEPEAAKPAPARRTTVIMAGGRYRSVERAAGGQNVEILLPPGKMWSADSAGVLWSAADQRVSCPERSWDIGARVDALIPLDEGWMAIRTGNGCRIARCDRPDLFVLPVEER